MKTYRRYSSAAAAANGKPIIQVGKTYLVGEPGDEIDGLTSITLISNQNHVGTVTARHLDRLGNANWATPGRTIPATVFHKEG